MTSASTRPMPVLYHAPVTLTAEAHGDLKVARTRTYKYARNVNSVPVLVSEIPNLLPHYPIAFTVSDQPMLIALLGIRQNENLFVDAEGNWLSNTYIPAYVRRYPFVMMDIGAGKFALGAELDPEFFVTDGASLFQNGRPAEAAETALRFCLELQKALEETKVFCENIYKAKVLRDKIFTLTLGSGRKMRLGGFSAIDENAIVQLDNRTANLWRKQNWLKHIYGHIASLVQLKSFALRIDLRNAA